MPGFRPAPAQGMGVCGVGAAGDPPRFRMRPDLCPSEGHPGVTYNVALDKTWCLCGAVVVDGNSFDWDKAFGPPLRETIDY